MFSDPQVITVNSVAKSMPRVEQNGRQAVYSLADGSFKLTISHQANKDRVRSMARFDQRLIAVDPISSANDYEDGGIYVVVDRPLVGFSLTQLEQMRAGFLTWLDSTAFAKLFGQES